MSVYIHHIEFIERTLNILSQHECNHEKTLFLNCCVGLLLMPQQLAARTKTISIDETVDYDNWGIDISQIKKNDACEGLDKNSVENIARHFRNSISHYRFDVMSCNKKYIEKIVVIDKKGEGDKAKTTFHLEMSFSDFSKFVLKYATVLKDKLRQY